MNLPTAEPGPQSPTGARLDQLAAVFQEDSLSTLKRIQAIEPNFEPIRGWVPALIADRLLETTSPRLDLSAGEELLRDAFAVARDSGHPNWQEMALPVLKNRLLTLTDGSFREADFGAPNLHYFVAQFPKLVIKQHRRPHAIARLVADLPAPSALPTDPPLSPPVRQERPKVRPDLWAAVLDYRSGQVYIWNRVTQLAERGSVDQDRLLFPTASSDDLAEWRNDFIKSVTAGADEAERERIAAWSTRSGATALLPARFRGLWSGALRDRVIERATAFFVSENLPVPNDLVISMKVPTEEAPSQVASLRKELHRLIDELSADELGLVSLPATALLRVARPNT